MNLHAQTASSKGDASPRIPWNQIVAVQQIARPDLGWECSYAFLKLPGWLDYGDVGALPIMPHDYAALRAGGIPDVPMTTNPTRLFKKMHAADRQSGWQYQRPRLPDDYYGNEEIPLAVDLFSGCGGLSLGIEQAGFALRACVESDWWAALTYRANLRPCCQFLMDARRLDTELFADWAKLRPGEVALVAGGPPCQSFSTLNSKRSVTDPRSDLVFEFNRLVKTLRSRCFLFENAPGILSLDKGKFWQSWLEDWGKDYRVRWGKLNAADYGVPQNRVRVITVGTRTDLGIHPTLPEPTHASAQERQSNLFAAQRELHLTLGEAIGDLPSLLMGSRWVGEESMPGSTMSGGGFGCSVTQGGILVPWDGRYALDDDPRFWRCRRCGKFNLVERQWCHHCETNISPLVVVRKRVLTP